MLLNSHKVELGWQPQEFSLADASGKRYTLGQLQGEKGLVVAFICNHCPYVKDIIVRLINSAKKLQSQGINFVAISSNDYKYVPEDSPPMMEKFARQHGFTFPYLVDSDQAVAKAFDAVCTPDFFGLNHLGELQYRGRLDDLKYSAAGQATPELVNAMSQIAQTGRGPDTQNPSIGCSIKWA